MILDAAPEGARVLDLSAIHAARAEAHKDEPLPVVKLSAGFVEMKHEIELGAVEDFAKADFRSGLAKMLKDPGDVDALFDGGLTRDDLESLNRFLTGQTLGK